MHSYKTITLISILIILLGGIVPSLICSDWLWLSRSGALLVIFGIFIVWLDYKSSINNDLDTVFEGFQNYLESKNVANRENVEKEVSTQFDKVKNSNNKRFKNIEFFIVAVGTFIWAYGDLIGKVLT